MQEKTYDFLNRMQEIHQPKRRNHQLNPDKDEIEIDETWSLSISPDCPPMILKSALDLQHYFLVSMELSLRIVYSAGPRQIALSMDGDGKPGSFRLTVVPDSISISRADERGALYGGIHLEDLMNLREVPYLKTGSYLCEPLLKMRLVHSGSGIDDYPDWQLNAILHVGFNAIDVFVRDIDRTGTGAYCNINRLIKRAACFGLDTILYNYLKCYKHPDDPDAEEFFDSVYGNLFRHYPGARGISLVGESLEFPSRDPASTGKSRRESMTDGIPSSKPSPGWYPCCDYPAFLQRIEQAVHRVKPNAEIIFSTYNWGYAPLELRRRFLEQMPKGITLAAAYEVFNLTS